MPNSNQQLFCLGEITQVEDSNLLFEEYRLEEILQHLYEGFKCRQLAEKNETITPQQRGEQFTLHERLSKFFIHSFAQIKKDGQRAIS